MRLYNVMIGLILVLILSVSPMFMGNASAGEGPVLFMVKALGNPIYILQG